jgi:molybdate transport system substrate-binding protein
VTKLLAAFIAFMPLLAACSPSGCKEGSCPQLVVPMTVFAAASLQPPFDQIRAQARYYAIDTRLVYAGTQTLTNQLTQGAQADVFASADTAHMTTMSKAGLVEGTAQVFAHNHLAIAVAKGNPKGIRGLADLTRKGLVVVLADPSVPAGKYSQQALAKAGVTVRPASLELQVTAVLTKVAIGEADAGIVYDSDVKTNSTVEGVAIPDQYNIVADYTIAILKHASQSGAAHAFVDLVLGPTGQSILAADGFDKA